MLKETDPHCLLLISSTTETGHAEAQKSLNFADFHVYLPFDFSWVIRPIIRRVRPNLVLLCETDFWYNFLDAAKRVGAKTALVNGKISERSLGRFRQFRFLAKPIFALIDLFCLQSERYRQRFLQLNIPSKKMIVTGNIKLDGNCSPLTDNELETWRKKMGLTPQTPVIVAGSTHHPEEEILLDALEVLSKNLPALKLILVPRHPERFSEVTALLQNKALPFIRFSHIENANGSEKIILMDTMGLLRTCYQLADVAFVGGSFTKKVGGHNILEPSWYGKPVVFGPEMHTQLDLVDFMKEFQAGVQVPKEMLTETLQHFLSSKTSAQKIGAAGLALVQAMQGATARTFEALNLIR